MGHKSTRHAELHNSEQGQMHPCLRSVPIGSRFQKGVFAESQKKNSCLINPSTDQKGNQNQKKQGKRGKRCTKQTNKQTRKHLN